jgi:hypothetical protein
MKSLLKSLLLSFGQWLAEISNSHAGTVGCAAFHAHCVILEHYREYPYNFPRSNDYESH